MTHLEFNEILKSEFQNLSRVQQLLRDYFITTGNRFTGSQFEQCCDSARPNEITEKDLLAVQTLSVEIPIRPALWILSADGSQQISKLLSQTKPSTEMWDQEAKAALAEDGPLGKLWGLLSTAFWPEPKKGNGLATTKISKLIATKRPRLSPVLDSVITQKVFPETSRYWESFRGALCDENLREHLLSVTDIPEVPADVCLLRRIDVVLWSRHNRKPRELGVCQASGFTSYFSLDQTKTLSYYRREGSSIEHQSIDEEIRARIAAKDDRKFVAIIEGSLEFISRYRELLTLPDAIIYVSDVDTLRSIGITPVDVHWKKGDKKIDLSKFLGKG